MNKYTFFVIILFVFFSCKKDRLKGESEILVGKWRWVKTIKLLSQQQNIYSDPLINGNDYEIEFVKCGKLFFSKNENIIFEKKIKFDGDFGCVNNFCVYYLILNGTEEIETRVYNSSKDSLFITKYPFNEYIDGDGNPANYWNVYVRE